MPMTNEDIRTSQGSSPGSRLVGELPGERGPDAVSNRCGVAVPQALGELDPEVQGVDALHPVAEVARGHEVRRVVRAAEVERDDVVDRQDDAAPDAARGAAVDAREVVSE